MIVTGIQTQQLLTGYRVTHIELMRADGIAFAADTKQLRLNRVEQVLSPEGRKGLLEEIRAIREAVQSADRIIASLIDRYLEEYGTSLDDLQDYASDLFQEEDELEEEAD